MPNHPLIARHAPLSTFERHIMIMRSDSSFSCDARADEFEIERAIGSAIANRRPDTLGSLQCVTIQSLQAIYSNAMQLQLRTASEVNHGCWCTLREGIARPWNVEVSDPALNPSPASILVDKEPAERQGSHGHPRGLGHAAAARVSFGEREGGPLRTHGW